MDVPDSQRWVRGLQQGRTAQSSADSSCAVVVAPVWSWWCAFGCVFDICFWCVIVVVVWKSFDLLLLLFIIFFPRFGSWTSSCRSV